MSYSKADLGSPRPGTPETGCDDFIIRRLSATEAEARIDELAVILVDVVRQGASVGFLSPLSIDRSRVFWGGVAESVSRGERILLVAEAGGRIVGTVQIVLALPENQPHRGEIAKLQVLQSMQRQGIATALMAEAEAQALEAGRTLLALDTTSGEAAENLYLALGWTRFGIMPGHALFPDGRRSDTSFFYKEIVSSRGA